MFWFALILAIVVSLAVGLFTRDITRALRAGLITLGAGVVLSLVLIFSGMMGG